MVPGNIASSMPSYMSNYSASISASASASDDNELEDYDWETLL